MKLFHLADYRKPQVRAASFGRAWRIEEEPAVSLTFLQRLKARYFALLWADRDRLTLHGLLQRFFS